MALGEALAVGAEDGREVREFRHRVAERFVDGDLLRRIREMIVSANDMRDLHVGVVDYDHIVVDRNTGRPNDDRIAYHLVGELYGATHDVVETNRALGNLEANSARLTGGLALACG